ncbi:MAG: tyrosine-protein phosphatase [Dysgonamonadaceae bacterium]|jgi:protein-tyrosine phosphatase|nr:tyrosine-protein phosphatase [Dysgonamonadaceae bacterium]
MLRRLIFIIPALILAAACGKDKVDVRVSCQATMSGNYLLEWQSFPPLKGEVKIYESLSPDSFNLNSPMVTAEINSNYKSVVAIRPQRRSYFKLVFNNKYSVMTAERSIPMKVIYNFRDLGGYYNENEKQTRWGKIYRSSSLQQRYSERDFSNIKSLGIKSVIDFEKVTFPYKEPVARENIFILTLRGNPDALPFYFDKILSRELKRIDVILIRQDALLWVLENNSDYFVKMFDLLLDKRNYPIVLNCAHGTDKTGLASALVLAALGVDREQIISDFTLSDDYINYEGLIRNADIYGIDIQETLTAILSAHREIITYVLDSIIKEYGSMNAYFDKVLGLTKEKREMLRNIMLYQE